MSTERRIHVGILPAILVVATLLLAVGCSPGGGIARIPLTTGSDEARAHYIEGRTALDLGRLRHARWRFKLALRADPEFAMAHLGAFETAENRAAALKSLTRAVALSERVSIGERDIIFSSSAFFDGDSLNEHKRLKDLVRRYPDDSRAHLLLGDLFARADNPSAAIESYREAQRLAAGDPAPRVRMVRVYRDQSRLDEALELMQGVVEQEPDRAPVQQLLADLLMKAGRLDEAIETYRTSIALDETQADSWIGLGHAELFKGNFAAADEAFSRLRQLAIDEESEELQAEADEWMAAALMHRGELDAAVELLDAAAREAESASRPMNSVRMRTLAAESLLNQSRIDDAREQLDAARVQLAREELSYQARTTGMTVDAYYRIRLAIANGELGRAREMTADYRRDTTSARIPGSKNRVNELTGRIALGEDNWRLAASLLNRSDRDSPRLILLRFRAISAMDQAEQSRDLLETVVNFNEPHLELGQALPEARRLLSDL